MKLDGLTFTVQFLTRAIKKKEGPSSIQFKQRKKLYYQKFLQFAMMSFLDLHTSAAQFSSH